jgi:hypothetical protein
LFWCTSRVSRRLTLSSGGLPIAGLFWSSSVGILADSRALFLHLQHRELARVGGAVVAAVGERRLERVPVLGAQCIIHVRADCDKIDTALDTGLGVHRENEREKHKNKNKNRCV